MGSLVFIGFIIYTAEALKSRGLHSVVVVVVVVHASFLPARPFFALFPGPHLSRLQAIVFSQPPLFLLRLNPQHYSGLQKNAGVLGRGLGRVARKEWSMLWLRKRRSSDLLEVYSFHMNALCILSADGGG